VITVSVFSKSTCLPTVRERFQVILVQLQLVALSATRTHYNLAKQDCWTLPETSTKLLEYQITAPIGRRGRPQQYVEYNKNKQKEGCPHRNYSCYGVPRIQVRFLRNNNTATFAVRNAGFFFGRIKRRKNGCFGNSGY